MKITMEKEVKMPWQLRKIENNHGKSKKTAMEGKKTRKYPWGK